MFGHRVRSAVIWSWGHLDSKATYCFACNNVWVFLSEFSVQLVLVYLSCRVEFKTNVVNYIPESRWRFQEWRWRLRARWWVERAFGRWWWTRRWQKSSSWCCRCWMSAVRSHPTTCRILGCTGGRTRSAPPPTYIHTRILSHMDQTELS